MTNIAYFTEAELEGRTGRLFSTTSTPDTTAIGILATEISAMYDGLAQQTEGTHGTTGAPEYARQACLSAAHYTVDMIRANLPVDTEKQIRIMKNFLTGTATTKMTYKQEYPKQSGSW